MVAWRIVSIVGCLLAVSAARAETYPLAETVQSGDCFQVHLEMKLAGKMKVQQKGETATLKLEAAADFLKSLKGQDVEVALSGLTITCDALRSGQQTLSLAVDPDHAAALIEKAKSAPGVVAAGWTTGLVEMDRAIRFPAADWRDGDKINRDKLVASVANVLSTTLSAKLASSSWSPTTGKLKLIFKRPSTVYPALDLTDSIEVNGLVSPDKPGSSDHLMLWISNPVTTTSDESTGAKLTLSDSSTGDEDSEEQDNSGSVEALTKELKGQRWDADKSVWK